MRLLLVSQEYPPETGWGGIGTYVGLHAPALAAAGVEVHLLSVVAGQQASDIERDGVLIHRRPLRRVRGPGRVAHQSWIRFELAANVARCARGLGRFDVVESPEWMAESLLLRGRPLVVRLHSSAAQVFPFVHRRGADARLAMGIEHRGMRRADLLVGSAVQVSSLPAGRWPPAVEIPYPVGERPLRPAWTEGPPRVVFAGRFEWRKGPDLLVEALPALRRAVPAARLVLVGRDTSADGTSVLADLRARGAALGVGDALDVREEWGAAGVEAALAGAAVCAVPSRWESFGYVAAEALAGATPTAVSGWKSLAEIAGHGDGAVVVGEESGAAWAAALTRLLGDPRAARAEAEGGRARLMAQASPAIVAARTIAAYERAMRA